MTPAPTMTRTALFHEPGRFAGWPANYGMWSWGQEVLAVFVVGWIGEDTSIHARDTSRPFVPVQARSFDGGRTWDIEGFPGVIPGDSETLNGDEHVQQHLKAGPHLRPSDFSPPTSPYAFDDPETIILCGRTDLERGSVSWYYASRDRGTSWAGPHPFPDFGRLGVSARSDVIPLGGPQALFLLSGSKRDGTEGHAFAARTDDGGRSFQLVSMIGPEPSGWTIMPSSVRNADGTILTALRCFSDDGENRRHHIDLFRSPDEGRTWLPHGTAVENTGGHGNPPAMVRTPDGTLVIHYGHRDPPYGLRAVLSRDGGETWFEPLVLTDDTETLDMGYPRAVVLDDGTILIIFYTNSSEHGERTIDAVRWSVPPA